MVRRAIGLAEYQRMRCGWSGPKRIFRARILKSHGGSLIREVVEAKLANRSVETGAHRPLSALIERVIGRPAGPLQEDAKLDDLGLSSLIVWN